MRPMRISFVALVAICMPAHAGNWPTWRGPNADGISEERHLPVSWSVKENIRWRIPLPEPGNSTPIVWGNRVFITQGLAGGKRRAIIAFRRTDGQKLWQQEVPCVVKEPSHPQNPPCSASPVTDGSAIYAHFASAGVVAYDLDGKQLWRRDLGPVVHRFGNGSSPVLYKDLLIVHHGPGEPTFLSALDKRTGKTVWMQTETGIDNANFGSWSTPIVLHTSGRDELIMLLPGSRVGGEGEFKAYDPTRGIELWRCSGLGTEIYATPVPAPHSDLVVGISGHNGPIVAVRPGGHGDVTATHRLWRLATKIPQRIGSGIIHEGHLYLSDADGFVECLNVGTGNRVWKERLAGNVWGSMVLAAGNLYVSNLEGQTFVMAASPHFKLLARNDVGETIYAALAVSDGQLFLRTHKHLYCIANSQ